MNTTPTPNTIPTKVKGKRGRKAGSCSFMQVSLAELNRLLKPDAQVILSIRYAQIVGLKGKPVSATLDIMTFAAASGSAEMQMEDFDDDEAPAAMPQAMKKTEEEDEDDNHIPLSVDLESWDE